jgi:hypothetical protein
MSQDRDSKYADDLLKQPFPEFDEPIPTTIWDSLFANSQLWEDSLTKHVSIRKNDKRGRGRPKAWESENKRTSAAWYAALFVHLQMRNFRLRNNTKRVPNQVTEALINLTQRMHPLAKKTRIIREHLRENKKDFPW